MLEKTTTAFLNAFLCLKNIPRFHWNLVCLCNLNTVEKGFIDFEGKENNAEENSFDGEFTEYQPPCIFVFDSMCKGEIDPTTMSLINEIRYWLTYDEAINPKKYSFSSMNLPVTVVPSVQQDDSNSCGFFSLRNIFGLLISYGNIFPIKISHLAKETKSIGAYKTNFKDIFKENTPKTSKSLETKSH